MATLGEISFRLAKEFPGVDPDVRLGIINDRYTEILDRLPWSRLDTEYVFQTTAKYETGTVSVTAGAAALTLTGGTWTAAMSGRQIHFAGRSEYYTFTYLSAITGLIDRAFEGYTDAAATYVISQSIYAMPATCRIIRSFRNLSLPAPISKRDRASADFTDPGRILTGPPVRWNDWMDDNSTVPLSQVELWPSPDLAYSILASITVEKSAFAASDTSVAMVPWMRPGAMMAGCRADHFRLPGLKDLASAQTEEARFEQLVSAMVNNESRRTGAEQMNMQSQVTQHRMNRWARVYRDTRQIL